MEDRAHHAWLEHAFIGVTAKAPFGKMGSLSLGEHVHVTARVQPVVGPEYSTYWVGLVVENLWPQTAGLSQGYYHSPRR